MKPIEEFNWTISVLRKLFQFNSLDIFQSNCRYGFRYYMVLLIAVSLTVCYVSTIFDSHREFNIRFGASGLVFGAIQVYFGSVSTNQLHF